MVLGGRDNESILGMSGDENVRVRTAMVSLAQAELDLSRTKIVAPCNGFISNLAVDPGTAESFEGQVLEQLLVLALAALVLDVDPQLAELLSRAAYGKERFVLTRHGKEMGAIVPVEDLDLLERRGAQEERAYLSAQKLADEISSISMDGAHLQLSELSVRPTVSSSNENVK